MSDAIGSGDERLVLRDLLDAAVAEDLASLADRPLGPGPEGRAGSWVQVPLADGGWLAWPGRPGGRLQLTRYADGPVLTGGPGRPTREVTPAEVVGLLAPHAPCRDLVARDVATAVEHAAATAHPGDGDDEVLAASRGRPFHPTARAVAGWRGEDLARWGPGRDVALDWVAVRHDHLRLGSGTGSSALHALVPGAEALVIDPEYRAIPVHPFDHDHVLPERFARELAEGIVVPLARGVGVGRATAAVRTLDLGGDRHLKLPLGVTTLGSARLLPPRYLDNGERGELVLRRVLAADPALATRVDVADEATWAGFGNPDGSDEFDDRPGHLAAQVRRLPPARGRRLPLAALAAPAWDVLADRLGDPETVFPAVVGAVVDVGIGFLRHGVLPEMHGQNVLLDIEPSGRVRLLLRDHDTVRIHPAWLSVPDPGYRLRPGARQSLRADTAADLVAWFQTLVVQVGLYGMVDALTRHLGVSEHRFWTVVHRAVVHAVDATPSPTIRAALVATLLTADEWPHRSVLRPLLESGPSRGASMPAGWTRVPNPLRA